VVCDHLGAPLVVLDGDGAAKTQLHLDPYGRAIASGEADLVPHRFPGQWHDPETGLHYNRLRHYDPDTGQYLSRDPLGLRGGLAPLAYVHDPSGWVDPLGLAGAPSPGGGCGSDVSGTTTVIGRMDDLKKFDADPNIDTWWKSGRVPKAGEPPVTWKENEAWLRERVDRGDSFAIATDPATLPPVRGGYRPGQPNGYFTARELETLEGWGVEVVDISGG
jgi:RHS repeat-associated protein